MSANQNSKDIAGLGISESPLVQEKFKKFTGDAEFGTPDIDDAVSIGMSNGQLWRKSLRRVLVGNKIQTPEDLLYKLCEYFDDIDKNPVYSAQLVSFEGSSSLEPVPKMRVPTLAGICTHLGIHRDTWGAWRRGEYRHEFRKIVQWAEEIMADAKFVGAAAGLLNPMIISRDLGLSDKREVTSPDGSMTPRFDASKLSTAALAELSGLLDKDESNSDADEAGEDSNPA